MRKERRQRQCEAQGFLGGADVGVTGVGMDVDIGVERTG